MKFPLYSTLIQPITEYSLLFFVCNRLIVQHGKMFGILNKNYRNVFYYQVPGIVQCSATITVFLVINHVTYIDLSCIHQGGPIVHISANFKVALIYCKPGVGCVVIRSPLVPLSKFIQCSKTSFCPTKSTCSASVQVADFPPLPYLYDNKLIKYAKGTRMVVVSPYTHSFEVLL